MKKVIMANNYNNFGTIIEQHFISEFEWNEKTFNSYLIKFDEYEGYFRIIREIDHEQALIGGKMLFNYDGNSEKISGYRIIGWEKKKKKPNTKSSRVEELLEKRRQREQNRK